MQWRDLAHEFRLRSHFAWLRRIACAAVAGLDVSPREELLTSVSPAALILGARP